MDRIDSHQHFWVYQPGQYGWITPDKSALARDFQPADLQPLLREAKIAGTIAVQARQCLEETDWLLQLARKFDFIRGVVGWVDLCATDIREQLQRYAGEARLVGVRHVLHDEPDPRFMLQPAFRRGLSFLAEFGLVYDLLLFPRHLRPALELIDENPGQQFVLDHLAKPKIGGPGFARWRTGVKAMAARPNVACKLSGLVTEAPWGRWQKNDFTPYLDVVSEAFGSDRLMFGSDWPVCTLSGAYSAVTDLVASYLENLSPAVRGAVMGRNCARIYGLETRPA